MVLFLWRGVIKHFSLPKTSAKQDVIRCMADSVLATRTASTANSSPLISFSLVFVRGCKRLRLNRLPSVRNRI